LTAAAYGSASRQSALAVLSLAVMTALIFAKQRVGKKESRALVADPDDDRSKLALIREMKAQLMSGERQSLNADAQ
jgi:hypothetical protein